MHPRARESTNRHNTDIERSTLQINILADVACLQKRRVAGMVFVFRCDLRRVGAEDDDGACGKGPSLAHRVIEDVLTVVSGFYQAQPMTFALVSIQARFKVIDVVG